MWVNNTNFLTTMFVLPEGTLPTPDSISKAIAFNEARTSQYRNLYYYYRGFQSIYDRTKQQGYSNNKLMINHAEYIVDINTGYLLGDAIEYQAGNDDTGEMFDLDPILAQYKKQTIWATDHALALHNGIYGKNFEYIFVKKGSTDLKSVTITPTNCIIAYDDTLEHNKLFAIIYSLTGAFPSGSENLNMYNGYENVTVITDTEIINYCENKMLKAGKVTPHVFGEIPVIEYKNNYFSKGDFYSIVTLIDAYNILQSDRINDKEQLVEAALILKGMTMTKDQMDTFKQTRTMQVPTDAEISYLIKQLNETEVEVLKKSIVDDIHKISKTPNLSDENFVGNSSGVAIKYKLLAFEQSIKNKEAYLQKALLERFSIYNNYLNISIKMPIIPIEEITIKFKKNLPQNDLETSQMISALTGLVTKETLISQLSFIENANEELEQLKQNQLAEGNQEDPNFGTTTQSDVQQVPEKPIIQDKQVITK